MFSRKLLTISVLLLVFVAIFLFFSQQKEIKEVIVRDKTFSVEVARTRTELERGLSLHIPLLNDQGMLFVFTKEDFHDIWMKDMLFPIDVLWIDSNLRIIYMEKSILPDSYPKIFSPETKNLYVLEIPSGQVDFLNIKIGDKVKFVKSS